MLFVRISRLVKGAFTRGNHAFCTLQRKAMAELATNEIAPGTPSHRFATLRGTKICVASCRKSREDFYFFQRCGCSYIVKHLVCI